MDRRGQPNTALQIIADLGIEPEWTVVEEDGAGFVARELGTWLRTQPCDHGSERLHVEVRLAQGVDDTEETRKFLEEWNHNALVGRWVLDPASGVVVLITDLVVTDTTRPFATEAVAEMVNTAETLASKSMPQRFLGGLTALTLVEAGRRSDFHGIVNHLPDHVYPEGRSDRVPLRLLRQIQSQLSNWLPDWKFDHADDHSVAETENWNLLIRAVAHPQAGWGLQVVLGDRYRVEEAKALLYAQVFNRGDSHLARDLAAPGCWTYVYETLEYRVFLPAWLLRVGDDSDSLPFVSSVVKGVAGRANSPLLEHTNAVLGPVLTHPTWAKDNEAITLARREPINDGRDAADSFVWLGHFEQAAYTTEESYRLWRSRLQPEDLTDKGVVGYSAWFERELAARRRNRPTKQAAPEEGSDD
jgi:hypothetical protein